jgi:hypothetical protein
MRPKNLKKKLNLYPTHWGRDESTRRKKIEIKITIERLLLFYLNLIIGKISLWLWFYVSHAHTYSIHSHFAGMFVLLWGEHTQRNARNQKLKKKHIFIRIKIIARRILLRYCLAEQAILLMGLYYWSTIDCILCCLNRGMRQIKAFKAKWELLSKR